jgi:DNA polymerase
MARPIVHFDKEVASGAPIEWGRHQFLTDKQAHFQCMAWSINAMPTKLWLPGMPIPAPFLSPKDYTFSAFNIQFDQLAINILGPRYGFKEIPLENCQDVMALAGRYGLPQSLEKLGKALGVNLGKLKDGKRLVKLFCSPPFHNPKKDKIWNNQEFHKLCAYCKRDVDSMKEIISKLPASQLSASEQNVWQVTATINKRGVPVDHAAVVRINQVIDHYRATETKKVPLITDGEINTIGQRAKIIDWCSDRGVELENLQAATVDEVLKGFHVEPFDNKVYELLKLRQVLGGAAVKKYVRLQNMTLNGRIHDNLRYYGASTGRPTGGGFQMLNLPRATIKPIGEETPDDAVQRVIGTFYDTTVLKDPAILEHAKALVRPMLKAPEGKRIMAADWSSIEYILLMWFAGETEKVERFRNGFDPYIDFATKIFQVEYEYVNKDQRQQAKPPVLGAGYMLGARALVEYASGYGVILTLEEAQVLVNLYRSENPKVKKSWYALKNMAQYAVRNHGVPYRTHRCEFKVIYDRSGRHWLRFTIPSGRSLYYCEPKMASGPYGPAIKHKGVDPNKKIWTWIYLKPQRIIENCIQALGRDVMNGGLDRLIKHGYNPIVQVYDEAVMEEPKEGIQLRYEQATKLMCIPPTWAPDLPLFAEGYIAKRYRKG